MADNNRNQEQDSKSSVRQNQNDSQGSQKQNTSNQEDGQDQNSQRGTKWSNYQTRELSDDGYSDEGISDKESA